ncbi:DUF4435 domain-containing protein [Methanosarcina sp.]|uniref:DUF4435 domain-containing protein n=1 Tax=Methanosarcina sp. TaxID=2213 RepID=UPI003BB7B806
MTRDPCDQQDFIRDSYELQVEIHSLRQAHQGSFLLVEGSSDSRFYKKYIDSEKCQTIPACKKDIILELIPRMHRFKGIVGIVDSDFSYVEGESVRSENIIMTDTHDIETLIIESPALEGVFLEYIDEDKLRELETNVGKNIRDIVLCSGKYIGLLLLYSNKKQLYLKFENINFLKFIDRETLSINVEKLIEVVLENSNRQHIKVENILSELEKMEKNEFNLWCVCRGHDLVKILFIGIKYIFGSSNARYLDDPKGLERALRLAYESNFFVKTEIYNYMRQWESKNTPFIVCKSDLC